MKKIINIILDNVLLGTEIEVDSFYDDPLFPSEEELMLNEG